MRCAPTKGMKVCGRGSVLMTFHKFRNCGSFLFRNYFSMIWLSSTQLVETFVAMVFIDHTRVSRRSRAKDNAITEYDFSFQGGKHGVVVGRWTCNPEVPGSSPSPCHWMDLSLVAPNSTPPRCVNSQLVSLPSVGILNLLCLICAIFVCYAHLNIFTWNLRDRNVYYYYYYYMWFLRHFYF